MLLLHGGLRYDASDPVVPWYVIGNHDPDRATVGVVAADPGLARRIADVYRAAGVKDVAVLLLDRPFSLLPGPATIIHLAGGHAPAIAQALASSPLRSLLRLARERQVPIIAESAGAMALGVYALGCPDDDPEGSGRCNGLAWLEHTVIEAHFEQPARLRRLQSVLRRGDATLGLGIESGTALALTQGHGPLALGQGAVHLLRCTLEGLESTAVRAGQRLSLPLGTWKSGAALLPLP